MGERRLDNRLLYNDATIRVHARYGELRACVGWQLPRAKGNSAARAVVTLVDLAGSGPLA